MSCVATGWFVSAPAVLCRDVFRWYCSMSSFTRQYLPHPPSPITVHLSTTGICISIQKLSVGRLGSWDCHVGKKRDKTEKPLANLVWPPSMSVSVSGLMLEQRSLYLSGPVFNILPWKRRRCSLLVWCINFRFWFKFSSWSCPDLKLADSL